jgi:7-cyano-7-deazaguanine synthase in queuosine biosynthesis
MANRADAIIRAGNKLALAVKALDRAENSLLCVGDCGPGGEPCGGCASCKTRRALSDFDSAYANRSPRKPTPPSLRLIGPNGLEVRDQRR